MTDDRWKSDHQYKDHVLTEVKRQPKGYALGVGGAWLSIDDPGWTPEAGDTVRYFGRGFGWPVRGVVVFPRSGGMPLVARYQTVDEHKAEQDRHIAAERIKREQALEAERDDRDRRWAALPAEFRARFERFSAGKADWRVEYEPYELFCCEQAYAIAEGLRAAGKGTLDDVMAFSRLTLEQQRLVVPAIDDGHSGNTFGMAIRLAGWWLTKPENVALEHGALTMLVGCEEYGCTHVTP